MITEMEMEWAKMFANHETKVLGFDVDDLLKIKEYLAVNNKTPGDLK